MLPAQEAISVASIGTNTSISCRDNHYLFAGGRRTSPLAHLHGWWQHCWRLLLTFFFFCTLVLLYYSVVVMELAMVVGTVMVVMLFVYVGVVVCVMVVSVEVFNVVVWVVVVVSLFQERPAGIQTTCILVGTTSVTTPDASATRRKSRIIKQT